MATDDSVDGRRVDNSPANNNERNKDLQSKLSLASVCWKKKQRSNDKMEG